jgi:hypothetical protein
MAPEPVGSFGEAFERDLRALLAEFGIEDDSPDLEREGLAFRIDPDTADDPELTLRLLALLLSWTSSFAAHLDRQTTRLRKLEADHPD